ncbi:MAG: NADH-quinone oxidoreductase subunit N [Chitinophagales bacterium]|nr:NADH-quinone oxidoreductase subunit N [Chitinophagales bacterium]
MQLNQFLIMQHEVLLTIVLIIIMISELNFSTKNKSKVIGFSTFLFGIVTVIGFLPSQTGVLFGGMYKNTDLTILMKNILNLGVFIVFLQSAEWLRKPINQDKISEFYLLVVASLIGMNFMISSGNFLMLMIGLELATIPVAALAAFEQFNNKSAEAGIKLILLSAFATGISVFGVSIIYGINGTLYFTELSSGSLATLGMIFFFSGLAFKISIVPFHLWTADVYEGAPVNVTSFLSVISKGAAVFILMIVLLTVFKTNQGEWVWIIYATAVLTMTIGNLFAIRQQNLKRFLAFSSIAQAGFIFMGVIGGDQAGMTAVVYFVLIYAFSNLAAFGVIASISNASGKELISDFNGLYKTNPKLSLVMMIALFSLAGIPPVAGFFGKFFLFTSAASGGYYGLVLIGAINVTISLYYYLLVVKAMFINKSESPIQTFKSDGMMRVGLVICVIGIIMVGFASQIYEYIYSLSLVI